MKLLKNWLRKPRSRVLAFASALFAVGFTCAVIVLATDDSEMHTSPISKGLFVYDKIECDSYVDRFPELMWLVGAEEVCSSLSNKIKTNVVSLPFDFAIKGIRSVDLFISGSYPDYLEFVSTQKKEERLTWDQFCRAKMQINFILDDYPEFSKEELIDAFKLCVIISEMADSKMMRAKAWVYGISSEDEYNLLSAVIHDHLEVFPSYANLQLKQKNLVQDLIQTVPIERMFFFSCSYILMEKFVNIGCGGEKRDLFDMICFVHQCRVCGRGSSENSVKSYGLSSAVFDHLQLFQNSCIAATETGLQEGYEQYLSKRASWLGFDISSPLYRTLAIVGSIMNCYTLAEGRVVKESFLALNPEDISFLSVELEKMTTTEVDATRYTSRLLNNLKKNSLLGRSEENRLANAVSVGCTFLSKLIFMGQSQKLKIEGPLDFLQISEIATKDPMTLKQASFQISKTGHICQKKERRG